MAQMIISLREAFEALLLVAILVVYLEKTGRFGEKKYVYSGGFFALTIGAIAALTVYAIYGGLEELQKQIFEAITAFLAVIVLTYMILWMAGRKVSSEIESKATKSFGWGIAVISFIFVVREVIETVLFLTPFAISDTSSTIIGVFLGVIGALFLVALIIKAEMKLDIKKFFYVTSIILAFVASGLVGYGAHEIIEVLEEQGVESPLFEKLYDLGIDTSNPLHHKGVVGGILAVLFGYSTSMEILRALLQFSYLVASLLLIFKAYRRRDLEGVE